VAKRNRIDKDPPFRPQKRLGQHFLKDQVLIERIVGHAGLKRSDIVLEIGPGLGALTVPMAEAAGQVVAVEKDPSLVENLRKRLVLQGIENVTLHHADILKIDLSGLFKVEDQKIKVIGNLPYNISSPLLEKLVSNRVRVSEAILMFQQELAKRLVALPGTKAYGSLSVLIQYTALIRPILEVPKEAFYPKPKVDSMVLHFDFGIPHPRRAMDDVMLSRVVRGAFSQRRKTLRNALKASMPHSEAALIESLRKCNVDPGRRAESCSLDEFICVSDGLAVYLDKSAPQC
jgi:16S rRNA (adenine1518-N6/adenine1519-N6)-dimethyltransferase